MSESAEAGLKTCFHCGLPTPVAKAPTSVLDGMARSFCCAGCRAIAELIVNAGNGAYYAQRDGPSATARSADRAAREADALADDPEIQRTTTRVVAGGREAILVLEGARCAACAWLIERHLSSLDGVLEVQVSVATGRLRVVWSPETLSLSAILGAVREVGYSARPHQPDLEESRQRQERRASLRRLGVAGLGTMQVMMFAVGLYAGEASGMKSTYRDLLRWASLIVAIWVVGYAGRPFFQGAWADLRQRAPGMDVPVALAIGAAFLASAWATITGTGSVYFESACMFTFFLGLTRHLEMSARFGRDARIRGRLGSLPNWVWRLGASGSERVPASVLRPGDRVRLEAGDRVPADGRLISGTGESDESLLTGEAAPRRKRPGDPLLGGSRWLREVGVLCVERIGAESTAARIAALLERAQLDRPPAARLADRVAGRFVTAVILASLVVFGVWQWVSPEDAFWVTLSVLVATCPCALSLATPTALASASDGLAERGFLICRGRVLETLARVTHVVFDKTGTLTEAEHRVTEICSVDGTGKASLLGLARALERHSEHPIASAFRAGSPGPEIVLAEADAENRLSEIHSHRGYGIEALLDGCRVRLGRPDWVGGSSESAPQSIGPLDRDTRVALGVGGRVIGWFAIGSAVRNDARAVVSALRGRGAEVSLASGDPSESAVARLAAAVGIESFRAACRPEEKVAQVADLQADGEIVAVVGDGQNDAPVMARADVGIALGGGADLARVSADAVILGDQLSVLEDAFAHANRTRRIMRQNLVWAVVYNLAVLPAAAAGLLLPWMAALGMSASSLLVVGNSLRLRRLPASPSRRRPKAAAEAGGTRPQPLWVGP